MGAACSGNREKQEELLLRMQQGETLESKKKKLEQEQAKLATLMQTIDEKQKAIQTTRTLTDEELKKILDSTTTLGDADVNQVNDLKGDLDACKTRIDTLHAKIAEANRKQSLKVTAAQS